jgi:RNA polymerase sigma factor (TIGR02999 family)
MAQALKLRREPAGSYASLLCFPKANCPAAPINKVRVAHVMADPDKADPTAGDSNPRMELFEALYVQLRQIAQSALRSCGPHLTLSPTTVLHEAYLKISASQALQFPDQKHFMAYASRTMRSLIIDFVRERRALKRGSAFVITSMASEDSEGVVDEITLARIGEAVDELATVDASLAELVDLKFFCGFSFAEIGAMRAVSERTVQRDWSKARVYLRDVLCEP